MGAVQYEDLPPMRRRDGAVFQVVQDISELSMSNKRFVDEIGSQPKIFAYPYGEYNLEVLEQVKLHGFEAAFGQHSGVAHKSLGLYELPRFAC